MLAIDGFELSKRREESESHSTMGKYSVSEGQSSFLNVNWKKAVGQFT
jgi:hypothetical protein